MADYMPAPTKREPWDLIMAFAEDQNKQAARDQAAVQAIDTAEALERRVMERLLMQQNNEAARHSRDRTERLADYDRTRADKSAESEATAQRNLKLYKDKAQYDVDMAIKHPEFYAPRRGFGRAGVNKADEPPVQPGVTRKFVGVKDMEEFNDYLKREGLEVVNEGTWRGRNYVEYRKKAPANPAADQPLVEQEPSAKGSKGAAPKSNPNVQKPGATPKAGVESGPGIIGTIEQGLGALPKGGPSADDITRGAPPINGEVDPATQGLEGALDKPGITRQEFRENFQKSIGRNPDGSRKVPQKTSELPQGSGIMADTYNAFRRAGLSDAGARAALAEVGRENNFQPQYMFGDHSDPHNRATNVGLFSWQGPRRKAVMAKLAEEGLLENGKPIPSQDTLDVMAEFAVSEMEPRLKNYLGRDDADYNVAKRQLGRNFIKWRYDDPKYASGHRNRDDWYSRANQLIDKKRVRPEVRATADPDIFDVLFDEPRIA